MDIRLRVAGEAHLNDMGNAGKVHAASRDVRREQNRAVRFPENFCRPRSLRLRQFRVDFEQLSRVEWMSVFRGLDAAEHRASKGCVCRGVEENNSLEWLASFLCGLFDFPLAKLKKSRHLILEVVRLDNLLGNAFVSSDIVLAYTVDKLVSSLQCVSDDVLDFLWHSSGEHHRLTILLRSRRQAIFDDGLNLDPKAIVEQSISFVQNENVEIWGFDTAVVVRENILQAPWSGDQDVAAFTLSLGQHFPLLRSAYCQLADDLGILGHCPRITTDLFGQFSSRRNDDGSDVLCSGSLLALDTSS